MGIYSDALIAQLKEKKAQKGLGFHAVLAQSLNGVIGTKGSLPWHEPEDLKSFVQITQGGWLIMGRRTWEGLQGPLPGRQSIVLSKHSLLKVSDGVYSAASIGEAIKILPEKTRAFIIGGSQIYNACFPLLDEIWVTLIKVVCEGDAYFNAFTQIEPSQWKLIEQRSLSPRAELFGLRAVKRA